MDTFDLTGTELAGFRLTRRLGSGGMATVYHAENLLQPSIVRALKVIHPTLSVQSDFIRRFAEEAHNLERLTHPNVVRFHGLRQEGPHHIMELELLVGRTLAEVMESTGPRGRLPVLDVVRWMYQSASGVAAAHALEIAHRDLKPENLMLTDDGVVKVLDFGIARARDQAERATRVTTAGTVPGTAGYLAPETWEAGEAGPAADVYALGLTLAELLLGHHPFMPPDAPRPSRVQLMHAHITRGLPELRALRDDIPPWLQTVVVCATAQDPAQRYPSAAELAQALEAGAKTPAGLEPVPAPAPRPSSYTELALPTLQGGAAATPQDPVPDSRPPSASGARRWKWPAVGAVGLGAAGLAFMLWGGESEPTDSVSEGPPPTANPWVFVTVPSKPVALGLPADEGVGFWPGAGVRTPTVDFALQQHEVTWAELDPWLAANAQHAFGRPGAVPADPAARHSLPASGVPWTAADAYCRTLGVDVSLPTEEQWEFAARGEILRPYAWGDRAPDPLRTNAFGGQDWSVKPVMSSPQDRTPGAANKALYDLMGNVREWTADPYRVSTSGVTPPQAASAEQTMRTIRGLPLKPHPQGEVYERPRTGAAWRKPLCGTGACLTVDTLEGESLAQALQEVGFRCARDVLSPPEE